MPFFSPRISISDVPPGIVKMRTKCIFSSSIYHPVWVPVKSNVRESSKQALRSVANHDLAFIGEGQ